MGMATSFGMFFAPLIEDMGWTRAATSAAFSINIFIGGIFGIIGGWLNDKFGPRVVLPLFGLFSCLGYFLVSQMNAIWQFYLFFGVIVGLGSNVFVPAMSTVARWFVKRRSIMSGIAFSGSGVGLVCLPLIINWFLNAYDWRMSLVIMSITLAVVTLLAVIFVRTNPTKMGLIPYGANELSLNGDIHADDTSNSLTVKQALKTSGFWLLFTALLCYGFCFFAFQVHINVHAIDSGISSIGAASVLTVLGVAAIIGQLGLGALGDKIGNKKMFVLGMACIVLSVITIIFARDLWAFYIFAILLGLAFGNCSTQESPLVAWLFGLASHGTLLGFFAFSFTIGAAIGPMVFGSIYDNSGSYQSAFYISGAVALFGVITSFLMKRSISIK